MKRTTPKKMDKGEKKTLHDAAMARLVLSLKPVMMVIEIPVAVVMGTAMLRVKEQPVAMAKSAKS